MLLYTRLGWRKFVLLLKELGKPGLTEDFKADSMFEVVTSKAQPKSKIAERRAAILSHIKDPLAPNGLSGQLFILHTDIRRLECDAWLVPTPNSGGRFFASMTWMYPRSFYNTVRNRVFKSINKNGSVARMTHLPPTQSPRYLCDTCGHKLELCMAGVIEFFQAVFSDLGLEPVAVANTKKKSKKTMKRPRNDRARHLIALPVVATGGGGLRYATGQVLEILIAILHRYLRSYNVDIALVCYDDPTYSAAQHARMEVCRSLQYELWPALNQGLIHEAKILAKTAVRGELALFLGQDIGKGFVPNSKQILTQLARNLGFSSEKIAQLHRLNALDQGRFAIKFN